MPMSEARLVLLKNELTKKLSIMAENENVIRETNVSARFVRGNIFPYLRIIEANSETKIVAV